VDVIDLGLVEVEFQGQRKMVNKLRLVFESEQRLDDGRNCTISKNFTASLHPKAKLAEFLGKWRGRPVVPGETIDLAKLIGACCTIVVSHQQNLAGQNYAAIDAISKPTKRLTASGHYDPTATRQRIEDWKAREAGGRRAEAGGQSGGQRTSPQPPAYAGGVAGGARGAGQNAYAGAPQPPKSGAAPAARYAQQPTPAPVDAGQTQTANSGAAPADYDEEVGF
jgi:hypothetical protein